MTVKHVNGGIMVWGAFTAVGVGKLIRCEESIIGKENIKILERGILLTVQQKLTFQQDNAPAHTAKVTKIWLAENSFELMFWPG